MIYESIGLTLFVLPLFSLAKASLLAKTHLESFVLRDLIFIDSFFVFMMQMKIRFFFIYNFSLHDADGK